jgi:serine/threonine protein kinase
VTASDEVQSTGQFAAVHLRVEFERGKSGLEPERERTYHSGERIGASYVIQEPIGSGAFSSAYAAVRTDGGEAVCLKVVKNVKDFLDQGLDEIRVLLHLEEAARKKKSSLEAERIVSLYDFFYFREHLFIVTERLYENMYEYQRYCKTQDIKYFSLGRVQKITAQLVRALSFIHKNNIVSCDLKPENVLFESYQEALVKLIDFGNASYRTDTTAMASTYVQSRCYRAPEVILGLPYSEKIDIWSLGCVMVEMFTGYVLFQCERIEGMLARIVGIIGEFPEWMMNQGRFVDKYFINKADIKDDKNILVPKRTSLWQRLRSDDVSFVDFVCRCLQLDPHIRPTAQDLASHEFLKPARFVDGI